MRAKRIKLSEIHSLRFLEPQEVRLGREVGEEEEVELQLERVFPVVSTFLAASRLGSSVTGTQRMPKAVPVPPSSKQACKGSKHKPLNLTVGFLWILFHRSP